MNSINKAWNITDDSLALRYKNYRNALDNSKFGSGVVGFITAGGNVLISNVSGEDTVETVMGLGVDVALTLMELTPAGRVINIALTLTGFDPATKLKDIYRSLAYESEANYNNNKIAKLVGAKSVTIEKNILKVTMPDGTVYARPLSASFFPYGVTPSGLLTGGNGYTNDVLFGGNENDTLQGGNGSDLLIGGDGFDTYNAGTLDIIRDSDGKGRVFLSSTNIQLTGGTQIEKGSKIYKGKDGTTYELKGSDLIINDSITIENFSKISNDLDIVLVDIDDIVVTIGNNQSTEGGNGKHSMELIINGQRIKFKEGDIEQTYTHTWDGNTIKEEDRKFEVSGIVMQTSENLNVQAVVSGQGLIKDDDKDPNDDKPETYDPLAIDLNNDGIKGTNLDYKINFDLDNNGFKEATSWIDNNDAFIAIDKNNNGAIDNGSELFGNKSISNNAYAYTNPNAKNGFEALSEFDSNNDGIIDEKDKEFTNLLLWQDKNSNGISETDELIKLSDKVKSINLNLLIA